MTLASVRDRYSAEQISNYHASGLWGEETLPQIVAGHAADRGDKVFGTDATTSLTYADLDARSRVLAESLRGRGVGPGDRVLVQLPSWTDFFVIVTAVARLGAVTVPVMPIYRHDDVGFIIETSGATVAFTAQEFRGFDHAQMFQDLRATSTCLRHVVAVRSEGSLPSGVERLEDLLTTDAGTPQAPAVRPRATDSPEDTVALGPDAPFAMVFSSGTTSRPKGCLHTFNTMACGARLLAQGWNYTSDDVQFGPSPITHTTGLVTSFLLPLLAGASTHLVEQWDPRDGLRRIAEHGCTACVSATTFLQMVLDVYDPEVHDASTMRLWTSAGAPIPGAFVAQARAALPDMAVLSLYGRTENVTTTMCTLADDPERSVTSDGRALPGQEVRIVDETGREVPRGVEGDIAYRGAMNCLEYVGQPEETAAQYTADGFHRSGDLGRMDDDGFVRVTGRMKDIVIRGGMNISVRQVEDALAAHPDVAGVALVGMPDRNLGERVCCYLVPAPGATVTLAALTDYLLGLGLAIQKVPERLEVVDELPTTATGKIQKHVLRQRIADVLANEGVA